ncbi:MULTISPECIES: acylphosphatase [Halomonadaceae]|jgi:acylphosphatase|uniref:acylphosphatase n=2 Tax=Billgrantia TaxID=3137761 RepID=A0AAW4YRE9_9GAMM|nr:MULTISPECIES: acylphosphatase [Halomonas]MCE8024760.1 acylphosphatase [Halomonas aerodenitrificans]MCE8027206.1 acylphosphatase [Halomonas desiderata]MCE8038084.1 acylphosphatase [Halomonas sp. MCCC 1A11062]MCE8040873.1 acylphosphatase [Halomonas desiderata]MCE8045448.1 acylphosphatase [Halomonas desiderata]
MSKRCVKALVAGKVQGVWYRRAVQEQALQHGLTGYAKNLPDGQVEVLLCGNGEAVNQVSAWLWQGPPNARVTHVELEALECHDPDNFVCL